MLTFPIGLLSNKISLDLEVKAWEARVVANSGTVSASTLGYVNDFVIALKAAGLRSRFLRLNLFVGGQLAACLSPLFLNANESLSVFLGNTYDVNSTFVEGDYNENSGLQGSLVGGKDLDTGFNPSLVSAMSNNHGLLFYSRSASTAGTNRFYINSFSLAPNTSLYLLNNPGGLIYRISDFTSTFNTNIVFNKLYLSYRQGSTKKLFENGVLDANAAITFVAKPNSNIFVFGITGGGNNIDALGNCYGITDSIANDTEAASISTLLNDFYTNLSRNEY